MAASSSSFIPTPLAHADSQGEGHPRGTPLHDNENEKNRMSLESRIFYYVSLPTEDITRNQNAKRWLGFIIGFHETRNRESRLVIGANLWSVLLTSNREFEI
ncbi:hypothetical protein TNCV_4256111 [Trichonephila clavipes]|nr:hypothetical protein TNCV_4256111 [Trichonephila clavipes]